MGKKLVNNINLINDIRKRMNYEHFLIAGLNCTEDSSDYEVILNINTEEQYKDLLTNIIIDPIVKLHFPQETAYSYINDILKFLSVNCALVYNQIMERDNRINKEREKVRMDNYDPKGDKNGIYKVRISLQNKEQKSHIIVKVDSANLSSVEVIEDVLEALQELSNMDEERFVENIKHNIIENEADLFIAGDMFCSSKLGISDADLYDFPSYVVGVTIEEFQHN